MATASDKELAIAGVYSASMLELARAQGDADNLLGELIELADYVDRDEEFDRFFSSPTLDTAARERSIERIFRGRASDLLADSLQVLNAKGRLGLFRSVVEAYRAAHRELLGRIEAYVTTAVPLTELLRDRVREVVTGATGREADLVEDVDSSLIGGMVVRIGDRKFDGSVARNLGRLSRMLHERALMEIHGDRSYVA